MRSSFVADKIDLVKMQALLKSLPFVTAFDTVVVGCKEGAVTVELPYNERFSTPPHHFPASIVGLIGDVAAVSACLSCLPDGWAAATLDYTVKMTGSASGEKLVARGRILQNGKATSVAASDIYAVSEGVEAMCGSVLATSRNFQVKERGLGPKCDESCGCDSQSLTQIYGD